MSIFELRTKLNNGVINSTEFTQIVMDMQKREALLSKSYPKHIDANKKVNTIGRAKGHRKNKAHMN